MYARINLAHTNYNADTLDINVKKLRDPNTDELDKIYRAYVEYKNFSSVMPLFKEEYTYQQSDVFGYYDENKLVAFTLCFRYNDRNIAANQFAWTYHKPELRLGITSLKWLCAYYKFRCYDYIYLGDDTAYKQQLAGVEVLGKL
jgi:hypothetical protein